MEIEITKQYLLGNIPHYLVECKDKDGKSITAIACNKEVAIGRLILQNLELFNITVLNKNT